MAMRPRWCSFLAAVLLACVAQVLGDLIATGESYRHFIKEDQDPAWDSSGKDELSEAGYNMIPIVSGMMDAETLVWPTPVGAVWLHAIPFFRKVDFASRYNISTVWPYCQNQHECYVYSQPSNAEGPITINFPDGIAAFDFYLDLALDCVKETNKTVPCTLSAYTTQGDANIKPAATLERDVHSICDSPFVGQYFGLYADDMAADITGIGIHCEGSLPQVLGLVRIAEHPEKPVLSLQKPSQDQFLEM